NAPSSSYRRIEATTPRSPPSCPATCSPWARACICRYGPSTASPTSSAPSCGSRRTRAPPGATPASPGTDNSPAATSGCGHGTCTRTGTPTSTPRSTAMGTPRRGRAAPTCSCGGRPPIVATARAPTKLRAVARRPGGGGVSQRHPGLAPHDRIEDQSAYESWGWAEESGWQWGQPISPILVSPRRDNGLKYGFGEMALRKLGDKWMYTSVIGGTLKAYLLDNPWDDLYAIEPVTLLESGSPESATVVSSMYLGGIVPGATPEDFTLLVSQWVKDGDEEDGPHGW